MDLASTFGPEVSTCRFCNSLLRQDRNGSYADIDLANPEPWQCGGRYVASPSGSHEPIGGQPAGMDREKQRLTRTVATLADPAGIARLREAMETPGYPDSLGARADALEDADQAAGFLTDLACMDEEDGITETGRASLRGYVLARFPDAESGQASRCPECDSADGRVLCDGCKFEICRACGFPCACGDRDEEG